VLVNGRFARVTSATSTRTHVIVPDGVTTGPVVVDGIGCGTFTSNATCTPDTTTFSIMPAPTDGAYDLGEQLQFAVDGVPACTYTWLFGDGATGAGSHTHHAFAAPGAYTAILTARSSLLGTSHDVPGPLVVLPRCTAGPAAAVGSFVGMFATYDLMLTGSCSQMIAAGVKRVVLDAGSGTMITDFEAHSPTACSLPASGQIACGIKPSGRVCTLIATMPALMPLDTVHVDFQDAGGHTIASANPVTAASSAKACPIGNSPP
jgi:hypothetical protein